MRISCDANLEKLMIVAVHSTTVRPKTLIESTNHMTPPSSV